MTIKELAEMIRAMEQAFVPRLVNEGRTES